MGGFTLVSFNIWAYRNSDGRRNPKKKFPTKKYFRRIEVKQKNKYNLIILSKKINLLFFIIKIRMLSGEISNYLL
jgi:hypothetical protein